MDIGPFRMKGLLNKISLLDIVISVAYILSMPKDHPEDLSEKQKSCIHEEYVGEMWDYKGLHILRNDDHLKIYSKDKPDETVWEGKINLLEFDPFKEDVFGFWIHSDQIGEEREKWAKWFFNENPAELEISG